MQISRIIARSSFNDNTDATVYGLEAEFVIQPSPALQLNANFSYLHTSIKDLQIPNSRDPSGGRDDTDDYGDAREGGEEDDGSEADAQGEDFLEQQGFDRRIPK